MVGYATELGEAATEIIESIASGLLREVKDAYILDIRVKNEYLEGHILQAQQLHGGRVLWHLNQVAQDKTIIMHCRTVARVAPVASALRVTGFERVIELEGSYQGWQAAQQDGLLDLTSSNGVMFLYERTRQS